jgi:hypothetical protein
MQQMNLGAGGQNSVPSKDELRLKPKFPTHIVCLPLCCKSLQVLIQGL